MSCLPMRALTLLLLIFASPAAALYEGLQCVPYARAVSGVNIYGDAHTWWTQAAGHYDRGSKPRVGAVMAFQPYGAMRLGHVAAVRKILDARNVLVSHANWSTIDGIRGHIEENIRVVDVSEDNDWGTVQVWYTPNQAMGSTAWPLYGFIYPNAKRGDREVKMAVADLTGEKDSWSKPAAKPAPVAPKSEPVMRVLSFSKSTLAEIDKAAIREAKGKPAKADPIGDLLISAR